MVKSERFFTSSTKSFLDDEIVSMASHWHVDQPHPSLRELRELAEVCKLDLRVVIAYEDGEAEGLAVCCIEDARIHGVKAKAYRLFGAKLHDYNRIYAADWQTYQFLLTALIRDAKICGVDIIHLENLIPQEFQHEFAHRSGVLQEGMRVFESSKEDNGWGMITGKKSVKRHVKKVSALPGYKVETTVGDLGRKSIEELASMHIERWGFEDAPSAFSSSRRVQEYLCYPQNKVLTRVLIGDETLCCHFGMLFGDVLLWHTPLINIKYLKYSPLEILLAETANFCAQRDIGCLDLGLGNEGYKLRFSNSTRMVEDVLIPVNFLGTVIGLIRKVGRPEQVRKALERVQLQLSRVRNFISNFSNRILWYEVCGGGSLVEGDVVIIDKYEKFVDFCRGHSFAIKKWHYQRFRNGGFFVALRQNQHVLSYGWGTRAEEFYIGEIGKTIMTNGKVILFDFHTPSVYQRKGFYTSLLKRIRCCFPNDQIAIFAKKKNIASNKAIIKAGFSIVKESLWKENLSSKDT